MLFNEITVIQDDIPLFVRDGIPRAQIPFEKAQIALTGAPYLHPGRPEVIRALGHMPVNLIPAAVNPANAQILFREIDMSEPIRNRSIRKRKHAYPAVISVGFSIPVIQAEKGVGVLVYGENFLLVTRSSLDFFEHVSAKGVAPIGMIYTAVV